MWEIWRSRSYTANQTWSSRRLDTSASPTVTPADTPTAMPRIASGTVNFKDLSIRDDDMPGDEDDHHSEDSTNKSSILLPTKAPRVPERTKYVIILVGLPGRGKTFLCNKLKCYLNWLGHTTRHFNVGSYRRLQKGEREVQNADFFDAHNPAGLEARNRALYAALDDLTSYLYSAEGQVAIFDATNTTEERRQLLIRAFHGRFQYFFIESICTDEKVLEQNYRFKMQYSPDYRGMEMGQSLLDFKCRIQKYEEVYEPIENRNIHYIKLIDMVTGRGHMDVNRISGYLPGKIVFFLMQVCKAGMAQARRIWLTRHGQSEFNLVERIGGDSNLAPAGEVYARCLPDMLIGRLPLTDDEQCVPVSVWTSTLRRTIQTARYLPFPKLRWKALDEIQAGTCDGLTYEDIARQSPDEFAARSKDKLRYRYPAGESYMDVIQRLEPVIIEMEREKECIVVVGHQAVLRAILGYFMAKPLASIPTLDVPLHTLIELRPRPDGTMDFDYIPLPPDAASVAAAAAAATPGGGGGGGSCLGSPLLSPVYNHLRREARAGGGGGAGSDGGSGDPPTPTASSGAGMSLPPPPAPPPPPQTAPALAAAAAAAWGGKDIPVKTPPGGSTAAMAAPTAPAEAPAAAVFSTAAVSAATPIPAGPAAAAAEAAAAAAATPTSVSPATSVSLHSRAPSLAAGIAGSPEPVGALAASLAGGGVGTPESPSGMAAAAAALAAASESSRTRPVRVPYGATMGGGGSEGGAAPYDTGSPVHLAVHPPMPVHFTHPFPQAGHSHSFSHPHSPRSPSKLGPHLHAPTSPGAEHAEHGPPSPEASHAAQAAATSALDAISTLTSLTELSLTGLPNLPPIHVSKADSAAAAVGAAVTEALAAASAAEAAGPTAAEAAAEADAGAVGAVVKAALAKAVQAAEAQAGGASGEQA
ncbi:hypothetical protein HYH03_015969 [Edaphochlamys debaryana]|uniref:6-phosphofructo-2-kinase domain-containing protein n=1 Tax=Edaphochlamys debaryana TaxID=47281 RepID=A0A835XKW9_9CHLO|nr:hypothetical protein HYH03_015969 [Edaphochlamys debaryana]|eukprot:KAG2485295.1 hypothetical protein HYH03_015969 [Edaphochlamys debaryana]